MLTLLIFLEKTDLTPIIPVNNFVQALNHNYQRFDYSNSAKKICDKMMDSLV